VRIEVVYASVDAGGPVDGFSLVGADDRRWPLVSQPALDRRVLAADAPGGRYRVEGPAGWAPVGPIEPIALRGDVPPHALWIGRTHSYYLVHPQELPATAVDTLREARTGPPTPFHARLETGTDGRSALRVEPASWEGTVRVAVRLGETHFARPFRAHLGGGGAPLHAVAEPALMTTFDVLALPPDGKPVAGLEVVALSRADGLEARVAAKTNASGWARLDPIPVSADGFALAMRGREEARWDGAVFRHLGEARLLAPSGDASTGLTFRGGAAGDVVQVRVEGSDTYLLLPDPGRAASLAPGRYRWIVTRRDGAASGGPLDVGPERAEVDPPFAPLSTVSVRIRGGFATKEDRYDLHARRIEDGKEVSVVGGTIRNLLRRDADLSLPAGRWRVRLARGASESASKDVDLTAPGTRASLDLDAPR
jgi:hypothetical protein